MVTESMSAGLPLPIVVVEMTDPSNSSRRHPHDQNVWLGTQDGTRHRRKAGDRDGLDLLEQSVRALYDDVAVCTFLSLSRYCCVDNRRFFSFMIPAITMVVTYSVYVSAKQARKLA